MKQNIENIDLKMLENHSPTEGNTSGYVDDKWFMTVSARRFGMKFLRKGQTYRVDEGRVMRVLSGRAVCSINLQPYTLEADMLFFVSPGTIFEVEDYDADFDLQAFSLVELPADVMFETCAVFRLSGESLELTGEYFTLLWHEVNCSVRSRESVAAIQVALLARLHCFSGREEPFTHKDERFHRFLALLNEYGLRERNVSFYADKLCVTPNHLGFVIRQASGLTVMQWINRYIVQQAKIQLKYSNRPIGEIAEHLHFPNSSFFSKFFKKETGMTPGKYRKM